MKNTLFTAATLAIFTLASCGDSGNNAETTNDPNNTVGQTTDAPDGRETVYQIDPAASRINWKGVMFGVKEHFGTLDLVEGQITVQGGQLVDGNFNADLNTIRPEDEAYAPDDAPQGRRSDLIAHLKSADFFEVENHPNATLDIVEVTGNTARANFTVRGTTHEETIENIVVNESNGSVTARGTMTFDRQKYGVAFQTGLQDAVISDKIELDVEVVGRSAQPAI